MDISKIKNWVLNTWYAAQDMWTLHHVRKHYGLKIMGAEETIAHIKEYNCSIARYGDGELQIMLQMGEPTFQKGSAELAEGLRGVFKNPSDNLLVCMPSGLVSTYGLHEGGKNFWRGWAITHQPKVVSVIRQYLDKDYRFGDANISRPYSPYKSNRKAQKLFPMLKSLWHGRDILFVEGEKTRLGVGNDLFNNAKSIKRILCPAENAFDAYDRILETVISRWQGELVILALGPTATVLASDISQRGIQALDLGHIDIQYEWYLAGEKFVPVKGKYTNETLDGRQVDSCDDKEYLSQIIAEVK